MAQREPDPAVQVQAVPIPVLALDVQRGSIRASPGQCEVRFLANHFFNGSFFQGIIATEGRHPHRQAVCQKIKISARLLARGLKGVVSTCKTKLVHGKFTEL